MIERSALSLATGVRKISGELLPLENSFIPFDLLFRIGLEYEYDNQLSLKSLFSSLPHSEMGMRYHFRRLLENGWIQVHPSPSDRRSKLVTPTNKLLDRLALLDTEFKNLINQHSACTSEPILRLKPVVSHSEEKSRSR